ncbi:MAG: hypothetical protein AAF657_20090, partial [Acidobacteriota bacterium]
MPESQRGARHLSPMPYLAALLVAVTILVCAWPGFLSYDSFYMLRQARFGLTDSMHPPLMTLIWRALDSIYPGPALMLLFNASLFLLALVHLIG